jgi:2-desacetyl-2-hydroxyethyl bacteriochlorophyllide A dehydrogenase
MSNPRQKKMRAAVLVSPRQFQLKELEVLEPASDEVRIKVEYCGICSSNLAPWKGAPWFSYPFPPGAPGHESVGIVEQLGTKVPDLELGEHVSMLGNNGFAEYQIAKAKCVVPISSGHNQAPFLGEPLGCAMNVFRRAQVRKGDWVAIVGTGFLGIILLQLSAEAGARVIAISRRGFALRIAEKMGAILALSSKNRAELLDTVRNATGQMLCNVAIEAGGAQDTLDIASDLTGTRGRLVIAGYHQDGPRLVNMQEWNWRGIDVINAHERDEAVYVEGIRAAAQAVAGARIRLDELVSHFFPLEQIEEGFRTLERRPEGFVKGVVRLC